MFTRVVVLSTAALALAASAALAADAPKRSAERPAMIARYASAPITIDGKLDEEAWRQAVVYTTSLSTEAAKAGPAMQEGGEVRLAWNEEFLYVAIQYQDSDLVAEGDRDQLHHYLMGDLAEVFLKPAGNTWYWELYVTPRQHKTAFWFPGTGRMGLKSNEDYVMELLVAAQCQGTLNDWQDRDTGWTAEMAIPVKELTRHGDPFGPGQTWTILVARYNYSRFLENRGPELTMTPKLPMTSYHYHPGYAELWLEK